METPYTKAERATINAAWQSLEYLTSCTNWSDGPALKEAARLERAQMESTTGARAMVCKAWLEGLENPDRPAREFYWIRPGYLRAFLLGVGHNVQRMGDDYTGPMVEDARKACAAAVQANDDHTQRAIGRK